MAPRKLKPITIVNLHKNKNGKKRLYSLEKREQLSGVQSLNLNPNLNLNLLSVHLCRLPFWALKMRAEAEFVHRKSSLDCLICSENKRKQVVHK